MKRSIAGKDYFRRGQQHCKFVFMEAVLVSRLKAVMKHVPSVGSLDERQVFERARRILPYKQEICPPAVVHRANLYSRFAFAVKISSLAGHHGEWHGLSPGPIGCIAVDPRRVGDIDTANLQPVDHQPVGGNHNRSASYCDRSSDNERVGLQGGVSRLRNSIVSRRSRRSDRAACGRTAYGRTIPRGIVH
jgi:hypothetical protein